MWARFCCILVLLSLVGVSSTHFQPNHVFAPNNRQGSLQHHHSLQMTPSSDHKLGGIMEREEKKKIGSKAPRCDHKCYGCMPCEAIQVPTTTRHVMYTNYEPEGRKCKCGPTLFTP